MDPIVGCSHQTTTLMPRSTAARFFHSSPWPRSLRDARPVILSCGRWIRPSRCLRRLSDCHCGEKPIRLAPSHSCYYHSRHGSSSSAFPPTTKSPRIEIRENGTAVEVSLGAEGASAPRSVFHAAWLWMNQPDSVHPTSGQRLVSSPSSALGWRIVGAKVVDPPIEGERGAGRSPLIHPPPGCLHPTGTVYGSRSETMERSRQWLRVEWTRHDDGDQSDRHHVTHYSWSWLERCRYVAKEGETGKTRACALQRDSALAELEYHEVMESEAACFELLDAVFQQGAAIVRGAPPGDTRDDDNHEAKTAALLGKRLSGGRLSHGPLYGDTFHVRSVPDAINLAYTSTPLPPHQDLAYYQSPPGLQLLHCVHNRVECGGESTLVDAVAAAEQLRRWMPDKFDVLTRSCATFVKQREAADMVFRGPHILAVPPSPSAANRNASVPEVVAMRWAPPFQGPVLIDPDLLNDYWTAYMCLERMLDNSIPANAYLQPCGVTREEEQRLIAYSHQHTWERRLQEGEILVFNNQRILHGRRGFQLAGSDSERSGGRHFIGCYTNMEDTLSRYRLLWRQHGFPELGHSYVPAVGNGSTGMTLL
jgi:Taurine catabolism dioxygenase TauD, TfdA family